MNDLSSLSDDQLRALYQQPASPSSDLSHMSDDDLMAAYSAPPETPGVKRIYIGGQPKPSQPEPPSVLEDVAKSMVSGVGSGTVGLVGAIPDISATMHGLANKYLFDPVLNAVGLPPPPQGAEQPMDINQMFGSHNIQKQVERLTGEFYKPKTTYGKYAHAAGELAPSLLGGPEGVATKLVTRVAAPALVGETLSQLTAGTPLQPFAKIAGNFIGGYGAGRILAPRRVPPPTAEELKDAASKAYQHPEVAALELHPSSTAYASGKISDGLSREGFRELNAPQTFGLIKELKVAPGTTAKVADVQSVRTALGKVAGNFSNPVEQAAANKAIRGIDNYLANLKSFDVAAGNGSRAAEILKEARGNYAASKRVQRVDDAEYRAELNAASAHSGGNINNATRQALKSILKSPAKRRGFSAEEIAQMEKVVKGTATGNTLRAVGKLLATSGMHGAHIAGGSIVLAPFTHGLSLAAPVIGYGAKKLADRSTANAVAELDRMIAMRSPLGAAMPPPPLSTKPTISGLLSGLGGLRAEQLSPRVHPAD